MHVHGKTSTCAKTAECRGFESSTRGGGTLFVAEKALSGERSVAAFLYLLAVIHGPCVHVRWDYAGVL